MKIALFGKQYFEEYELVYQQIITLLEKGNCEISIYEPFFSKLSSNLKFENSPKLFNTTNELKVCGDILFSIGGDGTILDSVHIVANSGIPVLGINMGKLGFLSSTSISEVNYTINEVLKNNYIIDKRSLLKLETEKKHFGEINYALNELTIQKKDNLSMVVIHVYINNQFLNSYWADGLIIATPTGSTAYSLSCQGPIVAPGSENFIITPIASHNLTVRPIVISDTSEIKLKISGRSKLYMIGLDSRFEHIAKTEELCVSKCDFTFNLIQMSNKSFYDTIREKLKWGVDVRN